MFLTKTFSDQREGLYEKVKAEMSEFLSEINDSIRTSGCEVWEVIFSQDTKLE